MSMTDADFQNRKSVALERISNLQKRAYQASNSSLVPVYDTGAGGDEHSYRANRNAEYNGRVEKKAMLLNSNLQYLFEGVSATQNSQQLYEYLIKETSCIILAGKEAITKKEGGINWQEVHRISRETSRLEKDLSSRSTQLEAVKAIYRCFWTMD